MKKDNNEKFKMQVQKLKRYTTKNTNSTSNKKGAYYRFITSNRIIKFVFKLEKIVDRRA
jgi:hypothetical protein